MSNIWRAARFVLTHGWATDRRRLSVVAVLMAIGYLSSPFIGVALGALTNSALSGEVSLAVTLGVVVALLLIFELMMNHFAHLSYFELGDLQQMELLDEVAEIAHGAPRIDKFESSNFKRLLTLVTEGILGFRSALESTLQLTGLMLQIGVTTVILALVEPWLLLLPLAALPPVWLANRAQRVMNTAREDSAAEIQLSRHLVQVATSSASAKEVRLFGARDPLVDRQARAWSATTSRLWSAHRRSAVLRAAGQVWFALAYGAAVLLVLQRAASGQANVGEVVLVVTLAVQVSTQVAGALALLGTLQGVGRTAEHLESLRREGAAAVAGDDATERLTVTELASDRAERVPAGAELPSDRAERVPERLTTGITLQDVTFSYPGAAKPVLRGVNLHVPAGNSVALVGENGAGKSTLVKLLCGLYRPSSGRIIVDGVDLADLSAAAWQQRVATLFQDFAKLELRLRENVGSGRIDAVSNDEALWEAIELARARKLVESIGGLDQPLGHGYDNGRELSGGQWQTLALARTLMRQNPLLLVLDEPASALDATAEHALFEQFVASAHRTGRDTGAVTIFVSHRFSTVRDAQQIVVLDDGQVREEGDHATLVARGDLYAELFDLQASAYR